MLMVCNRLVKFWSKALDKGIRTRPKIIQNSARHFRSKKAQIFFLILTTVYVFMMLVLTGRVVTVSGEDDLEFL